MRRVLTYVLLGLLLAATVPLDGCRRGEQIPGFKFPHGYGR